MQMTTGWKHIGQVFHSCDWEVCYTVGLHVVLLAVHCLGWDTILQRTVGISWSACLPCNCILPENTLGVREIPFHAGYNKTLQCSESPPIFVAARDGQRAYYKLGWSNVHSNAKQIYAVEAKAYNSFTHACRMVVRVKLRPFCQSGLLIVGNNLPVWLWHC